MAMKNEVSTGPILTISIAGGLFLLVVIVGTQAGFMYMENAEVERKWDESPNAALDQLWKEQQANITEARVIDAQKKRYAMPIEQAMKIVAEKRGNITWGSPTTK